MIRNTIKAFCYGFLLYAGMLLAMDLHYYIGVYENPAWGLPTTAVWGVIGGTTFVVSWFSLYLLWRVFRFLMANSE